MNVTDYVLSWKSKGFSDGTIKPPISSNNSLKPAISYYYAYKMRAKFTGSCLNKIKLDLIMER